MSHTKRIKWTFTNFWKSADAAELTERVESVFPSCQDFMNVRLMPDVPDDLVLGRLEGVHQRHRELDDAESGADVAARTRDHVDEALAYFGRQLGKLFARQGAHVIGSVDAIEERHAVSGGCRPRNGG